MRSTAYRWVWAIPLSLATGASLVARDVSISSKDLLDGLANPSRWLSSRRRGRRRSAATAGRSRFDPSTGLFYVSARETCMTFTAQAPPEGYKAGDRTMGGTLRAADRGYGALRAIDPVTGERKWEL